MRNRDGEGAMVSEPGMQAQSSRLFQAGAAGKGGKWEGALRGGDVAQSRSLRQSRRSERESATWVLGIWRWGKREQPEIRSQGEK